jgi:hypothetical protein
MNKRTFIGLASAGVVLFGIIGATSSSQPGESSLPKHGTVSQSPSIEKQSASNAKLLCDGTTVTTNCEVDGVSYSTYVYHPAIAEKSHIEQVTTYQKQVTGYCTLCNDDTYSPTCATGSGACSHHGGVEEWNAPRYATVPVHSTKTVIDAPAQSA